MPGYTCTRCSKPGYVTRASADLGAVGGRDGIPSSLVVEVALCADCRTQAVRESSEAQRRRTM